MARDPLTYRHPRTLAEIDADPRAWWTNAAAEVEHEHAIRMQLEEDARRRLLTDGPAPLALSELIALAIVIAALLAAAVWLSIGTSNPSIHP